MRVRNQWPDRQGAKHARIIEVEATTFPMVINPDLYAGMSRYRIREFMQQHAPGHTQVDSEGLRAIVGGNPHEFTATLRALKAAIGGESQGGRFKVLCVAIVTRDAAGEGSQTVGGPLLERGAPRQTEQRRVGP